MTDGAEGPLPLQTQILISIRDELGQFRKDVNTRLSAVSLLLEVGHSQREKMGSDIRNLERDVKAQTFLGRRVDVLEHRVGSLEGRLQQSSQDDD